MISTYLIGILKPCNENMFFLLSICLIAIFLKCYFIKLVTSHEIHSAKTHKQWLFFIISIAGSLFGDIAWVIKLAHHLFIIPIDYSVVTFFIRIAWGFVIVQYQSLSLFIESLPSKQFTPRVFHIISVPLSCVLSTYFFYTAFFDNTLTSELERDLASNAAILPFELHAIRFTTFYLLCITLPSFYKTINHIH